MNLTYTLEPSHLLDYNRWAQKNHPNAGRTRIMLIVAMVSVSLWFTLTHENDSIPFRIIFFCLFMLFYWLFVRLWVYAFVRIAQWRMYTADKHKAVLCEHTITLGDDALVEVTAYNESRHSWNGIYRVLDLPDYIYIFVSAHLAHVIPKSAFADEADAKRFYERAAGLHAAAQGGG